MLTGLVNGGGDPTPCVAEVATGDVLSIAITSPAGGFSSGLGFLVAQVHADTQPTAAPAGFPEVHVATPPGAAIAVFALTPAGHSQVFTVGVAPPGLVRASAIDRARDAGRQRHLRGDGALDLVLL